MCVSSVFPNLTNNAYNRSNSLTHNLRSLPAVQMKIMDEINFKHSHAKLQKKNIIKIKNKIYNFACDENNIQFTCEIEANSVITFLDILIQKQEYLSLTLSVFRKPTHTNKYLSMDSCKPLNQTLQQMSHYFIVRQLYAVKNI